jgi:predicted Fe-Mo cluster-binding NifX family protein
MKLCIPVEKDEGLGSRIYGHFGSAPAFILIDPETMEHDSVVNNNAHHAHGMCNPLAALDSHLIDAMLLNSIGRRALEKLNAMGITVYRSNASTVEEAVREHMEGIFEVINIDSACAQHGQHHQGRVQGFVDIKG